MARYVPAAEVKRLLTIGDALEAAEEGYRLFGIERNVLSNPSASFMIVPNDVPTMFWIKAAFSKTLGVAGLSFAAQFGEYYFMVNDCRTGMLRGVIERAFMSKRRTGATAGVVAKRLARPGSKVAALVGAGQIGEQAVRAISHAFQLDEFRIASRTLEGAETFVRRLQPEVTAPLRAVATPEEAIRDADIVVTITVALAPFVKPGWLKAGALLLSMGGVAEVEYGVLKEIDRIIVDDLDYALLRGDMACWIDKGDITREAIQARIDADIGEVVCGAKPGRTSPDQRILAVIQGLTICDLVTANLVLRKAEEAGVGQSWETTRQLDLPEHQKVQPRSEMMVAGLKRRRPE